MSLLSMHYLQDLQHNVIMEELVIAIVEISFNVYLD